jgi:magnesium transporter
VRKELVQMRMAVAPMQDILGQVLRSQVVPVPAAAAPYFGDVMDHARRVGDTIDVLREIASAAMNVTLSLVTISQGEIVKRLAGWAALLAAPTLVASWYGMNFEFMPEFGGRYAYPILIGVVVVVCATLYRYLRRVGWL